MKFLLMVVGCCFIGHGYLTDEEESKFNRNQADLEYGVYQSARDFEKLAGKGRLSRSSEEIWRTRGADKNHREDLTDRKVWRSCNGCWSEYSSSEFIAVQRSLF